MTERRGTYWKRQTLLKAFGAALLVRAGMIEWYEGWTMMVFWPAVLGALLIVLMVVRWWRRPRALDHEEW